LSRRARRGSACACAALFCLVLFGFGFGFGFDAEAKSRRALGLAGDLGLGGFNGRATTTIQTGVDVQEGNLSLGLFGRVRFLIQDDPESGPVRGRDWDEASDYVHILRYLQYRRSFTTREAGEIKLAFQAGEVLGFTLGHGTLVRDYSNIADPDHPHSGVHLQLVGPRWQLATMVDNFINPQVVANRFAVRPFKKIPELVLGGSLVIDPQAPLVLEPERDVDGAYNLQPHVSEPLTLVGLDAEYVIGDPGRGRLTPYADLNTSMLGIGFHVGTTGEVPVAGGRGRLFGQIEYRVSSGGYAPAHMETFYDVERYQAGLAFDDPDRATHDEREPKFAGLARGIYGGQGVLGQAGFVMRRRVQLKAGASYRPGPDAVSIWGRATTQPISRLQLGLLVLARGVGGPHEGAAGVMAMAEGRFRLTENLYTLAQYTRSWSLRVDDRYFGILQSFNLSIGASWSG
jgi:hypothetical protein